MNLVQEISWGDLSWIALLLFLSGVVSLVLRLRLESKLFVASVRAIVQLLFLGLVLEWVFSRQRWYFVLAILFIMLLLAAFHAIRRSRWRYRGAFW